MSVEDLDMKIEVVVVPVSDVDRAKEFYGRLGWRLDVTPPGVVQFTPHGSGCSVQFGATLTSAAPGSAKEYVVVSDIVAAREALVAAGIEVGEIFHLGPDGPVSGPDPERRTYLAGPVQRSRRQQLGAAGDHDPASRSRRRRRDLVRLRERPGGGAAARGGRARRAREAHRRGRRELARLVCGVHGDRAERRGTAQVTARPPTFRCRRGIDDGYPSGMSDRDWVVVMSKRTGVPRRVWERAWKA